MERVKSLKSISKDLIEFGRSAPPLQAYNRQILQMLPQVVGARAATLWIVRDGQLLMADQVEKTPGAASSLKTPEDKQQAVIKRAYERQESISIGSGMAGENAENLIFVPVSDIQGVLGVVRLVFGDVESDKLSRLTQLAELICGYYSLYSANRVLSAKQQEREELDKLSKAILQLQHYTFSNHLPEVVVNSAVEIAPLDRAVLLTNNGKSEYGIVGVSSTIETTKDSAWSRLTGELAAVVSEMNEPLIFSKSDQKMEEIDNDQLREKVNSYLLMTDTSTLMVFPLVSGGEHIGVLILERFKDTKLTEIERVVCTIYAAHSASAVGNHRIFNSVPLHSFYAKKLEKEEEEVSRRPLRIWKAVKTAIFLAIIAALVYLGGFYPVTEKIGADCFVVPYNTRILTSNISGEIENVHFEQGSFVTEGTPLLQLRTEDIRLQLGRERENAKNIHAEMAMLRGRAEDETNPQQRGRMLAEIQALTHSYNAKLKEIELLENRLQDCLIVSPIDGIMLEPEDPDSLLGVTVTEGERLARVGASHEKVKIKIALPSNRVTEVEEDSQANIGLQPLLGYEDISATIRAIADRSVNYKDTNVFMATAVIPNRREDVGGNRPLLKAGMTGKARIIVPEDSTYFLIYGRRLLRQLRYWFF